MPKRKRVPFDALATARDKPLSLKSLTLNPADLYNKGKVWEAALAFPREILACKKLEKLLLYRAVSGDSTVPEELGTLTQLRELTLGGMHFRRLPDAIGKLTRLEVLDLAYSDFLEELPATIGTLASLHTLVVDSAFMTTVPASLWKLTKLRRLRLPDSLTTLPPGIGALTALEELSVPARALATVAAELPTLARLAALDLEEVEAEHELPASLGQLPALTRLTVTGTLPRLSHIVAAAPRLKKLVAIGTHASPKEKKLCATLMKLPHAKRAAALAKASA